MYFCFGQYENDVRSEIFESMLTNCSGFSSRDNGWFQNDILSYIEKQFCSHLQGDAQRNCQAMIQVNDEVLINQISQGIVRIDEENCQSFDRILLKYLATIVDLYLFPNVFYRTCWRNESHQTGLNRNSFHRYSTTRFSFPGWNAFISTRKYLWPSRHLRKYCNDPFLPIFHWSSLCSMF